jgi:DHA1 family multidrug resistance protein-like MFS transporter
MADWRRNLVAVWFSQFFSLMGFSLALPFSPFYIQHLGVTDPTAVKFWAGLTVSLASVALAVMSPVWGLLSDRYGRKPMLLRANVSGSIVLMLMGLAPNLGVFVALRFLQGLFTGTVTAAVTLVSCATPANRQGLALGSLSAAAFSGSTAGAMLGGLLADSVGYRNTFFVGATALGLATCLVLLTVQEPVRPAAPPLRSGLPPTHPIRERLAAVQASAPLLLLITYAAMTRRMDEAYLPLYVQQLNGGRLEGAARWSGLLSGFAGLGAMLSGVLAGHISDRRPAQTLTRVAACGYGTFMALLALATTLPWLFPLRFAAVFFAGSLDPMFNAWLSRRTPAAKRGSVFGLAVTAKSLGWILAPMMGAFIAVHVGIRWVFATAAVLGWLMVPLLTWAGRRLGQPSADSAAVPLAASAESAE